MKGKTDERRTSRRNQTFVEAVAVVEAVVVLASSTTGVRIGSAFLAGGEVLVGKLALESVGELVDWVGLSGGVPDEFDVC